MAETPGYEVLVRQMREEGVEDLFYIMGGPIVGVAGAAGDLGIRTIDCRHEQGAAMAAHGYARVKRTPGVCLAASGPATTNLLTGIANAFLDGVPMVALGGAAALRSNDTDAFQQYDQLSMAEPVTRWAARVNHGDRMAEYFNMAYRHALGPKPGPTYLDLPGDALNYRIDDADAWFPKGGQRPSRPAPDPSAVADAIKLLKAAERPVVISGSGIFWSDAGRELREFVEAARIPFFTTPQGRGVIPEDHELSFTAARGQAFREADVAVVVGTRMNFIISFMAPPRFADDLKVIQIDIDPAEIGHNRPVDVGIVADAKVALAAFTEAATAAGLGTSDSWIAQLSESDASKRQQTLQQAESDVTPIHPLRIANELVNYVDRDAIFCVDGMETLNYGRQWIPSYVEGARLNSGPNGCIGTGIPFALGAKAAAAARQVVAFVGDGSFLMNVQEFDTMVRHDLPVVAVISNNGGWTGGSNDTPGRTLGHGQRYHDVVEALGGHGELVTDPNEIRPAIERAFESGLPSCVNIHVEEHARATTVPFGGTSTLMSRD
ncbi:MAG TPA: thiamine pyrophosphate-binding protein [Dehalococcoidia bacterium]|nr:thiamine pyrophosphate-binding protein [Dehalococcoidia bacterium]